MEMGTEMLMRPKILVKICLHKNKRNKWSKRNIQYYKELQDHSDLDLHDNEETSEKNANEVDVNNMQDENLSDNVPPPSEDSVADFTPPPLLTPDLSVPEDTDNETPASARVDSTEASVTTDKSTQDIFNSDGYIVDNVKCARGKCVQEQSVSNLSTQPSLTSSVDLTTLQIVPTPSESSKASVPGPSAPKPQRSMLPRRKPAPTPGLLLALGRKPTQPSKVPPCC